MQRCTVCGQLARHRNTNIYAECRGPKPIGLGDMVAAGLAAVGITKERVAALVGGCGCDGRQEALNEIGRSIGIGRAPDGTQEKGP